ncbi:GCR1-dependent translation factor 1 [Savitreella phatthalungensis]
MSLARGAAVALDNIPTSIHDALPGIDTISSTSKGLFGDFDGHSFWTSLTMIVISELGDKTFLVAALMAMKHDRLTVFLGAFAALLIMSILSALLGHTMPSLLPKWLTQLLAAGLFFVFGVRMLREGLEMSKDATVKEEMLEVEHEIEDAEGKMESGTAGSNSRAVERGHASSQSADFRNPELGAQRSVIKSLTSGFRDQVESMINLMSLVLSPVFVQTFSLTFLGEWGDRSQIATIAMAAGSEYGWVIIGTVLGHSLCTALAVVGGRLLASKISVRTVTLCGGALFLAFGALYGLELLGYELIG